MDPGCGREGGHYDGAEQREAQLEALTMRGSRIKG